MITATEQNEVARMYDPKALPDQSTRRFITQKKARWLALNQRIADRFFQAGHFQLATKIRDCETTQALVCCSSCGKYWYVINRCKQRACVMCSFRVAQERQKYLMLMTQHMQHPKLVTLTMQAWDGHPKQGIDFIRNAFTKLRQTKLWTQVKGGAYIIELVPHPDYCHIHMHILIDAPFIPYQKLFGEWRRIIKQRAPQVDIRSASEAKARKYLAKDASKNMVFYTDPQNIVQWYEATRTSRLFATFGTWYHAHIEEQMELKAFDDLKPVCPFCGSENTCFYARDGPFLLGHQTWNETWQSYIGRVEELRALENVIVKEDQDGIPF